VKRDLHLVADDLTGALDSAAAFATPETPVTVSWAKPEPSSAGPFAFSTETRDAPVAAAIRRSGLAAAAIDATGRSLVFKKIDSLLRGHVAVELAAFARGFDRDRIVLAPAHPTLGRVTQGGVQLARDADGVLRPIAIDLAAQLAACGFGPRRNGDLPALVLADAERQADLEALVAREQTRGGRILWCGSGGLAQALAGPIQAHTAVPAGPTLLVIGTDHPVAAAQIEAIRAVDPDTVIAWREGDRASALGEEIARRLAARRVVVLVPDITPRPRDEAARTIAAMLTPLLHDLPPPGALFCSGGETLRMVCDALDAEGLQCEGFVADGIPRSRLRGGRWPGLAVTSKSGAFGAPDSLATLFLPATGLSAC
jgi:uncharacterized protein YgbK (DUF1537 family)